MIRFCFFHQVVLAGLFHLMTCSPGFAQSTSGEPVRVALRTSFAVPNEGITVGDLVDVSGGSPSMRARIAKLTLSGTRPHETSTTISRSEILARILLAGIASDEFELSGSDQIHVKEPDANDGNAVIVKAIQRHVSAASNIDEASVVVQLSLNASQIERFDRLDTSRLSIRPLAHADKILGRRMIELGLFEGNTMVSTLKVLATVSTRRPVLVTSRPIDIGETIDESNSHVEEREFLILGSEKYPSPEQFIGKSTTRRINAQRIVETKDVALRFSVAQKAKPIIRPRDIVNVVANKSGLKITLVGAEAMRGGHVGDVIPLRNPTSKEMIYGKIVNKNLVELVY